MFTNRKFTEFILNSIYAEIENNYWENTEHVFDKLDYKSRKLFFRVIREMVMESIKKELDTIITSGEDLNEDILRNLFTIAYNHDAYVVEQTFEQIQKNYGRKEE